MRIERVFKTGHECDACPALKIGVCQAMDDKQISHLRETGRIVSLSAGEQLLGQDERRRIAGSIRSGVVKISKLRSDGTEFVTQFLFPGDLMLLSEQSTDGFAVEAATKVEACLIDYDELLQLIFSRKETSRTALRLAAEELELSQNWVVKMGIAPVGERVAFLLLMLLEHRLSRTIDPTLEGEHAIEFPISRKNIAAFLGTTIESLSRQLHHLARIGVIRIVTSKKMIIRSKERLKAVALS